MANDDKSLSAEFQANAQRTQEGSFDFSFEIMLDKFSVLMRHKVKDPGERNKIAANLFDYSMHAIDKWIVSIQPEYLLETVTAQLKQALDPLLAPGCRDNIPADAPDRLATTSLELLRRAEKVEPGEFPQQNTYDKQRACNDYRAALMKLAKTAIFYADHFKEAIEQSNANVMIDKPILASRPIQLKHPPQA